MDDDPVFGRLVASNLTAGKGGIGGRFSDEDFIRAIRHGVRPDGSPLIIMPSELFNKLGEADLGAVIAYIKSLPPADNELPSTTAGPLVRLLVLLEENLLPAQVIDHDAPFPSMPAPGVTAEYGKYLAVACTACHGDDLGGQGEGGPNITAGGRPGKWSEADFINTLRTGVTPRGNNLDPENMPWKSFARLTDDELKAVWLYLRIVPTVEESE